MAGCITRFAPSPTGPLHLGHAYAAKVAHDAARASGGRFLLRLEDLDAARCRPAWASAIEEDLRWLGLIWDGPVLCQSTRLPAYEAALDTLWAKGLLYPCTCQRRDILEALGAPQEGLELGPDGPVYPGTCRPKAPPSGPRPEGVALRLNLARALAGRGPVIFEEEGPFATGPIVTETAYFLEKIGDPVLARRDMACAYHLAVVVDDAFQGVTRVTRGADLQEAARLQALLQDLLGLPRPRYHHHALVRDAAGKRLAKRDKALALSQLRAEGLTPEDIWRRAAAAL